MAEPGSRRRGRPRTEPRIPIQSYLSPDMAEQVQAMLERQDLTMAEAVRQGLKLLLRESRLDAEKTTLK